MGFAEAVEGPVGVVELPGQGFTGIIGQNGDICAFAKRPDYINRG